MTRSVAVRVGLALVCLAVAAGCATLDKGASDQDQVRAVLNAWRDAVQSKDLERLMALYSDAYMAQTGDKAATRDFMETLFTRDLLKDATIGVENAEITVDGDKARVAPVTLSGGGRSMSLRLDLAKEKGQWLIVSADEA